MNNIYPIILAGGNGTRLWPLSTKNKPKQFLKLIGNYTLLQNTILRILEIGIKNPPIIITNVLYLEIVKSQLREINIDNYKIVLEPIGKNTLPASIVASIMVKSLYGEESSILLSPSDHIINDTASYKKAMEIAYGAVGKDLFATFGIKPDVPATGYGYIKQGEEIDNDVFLIEKFVEKPKQEIAQEYLSSGQYYWNSGIFLLPVRSYIDTVSTLEHEILELCKQSLPVNLDIDVVNLGKSFEDIKPNSIDYAVMEKIDNGAIVPVSMEWSDLGCWYSIYNIDQSDEHNNVIKNNIINISSTNCYLRNETNLNVATVGLDNVIVIVTEQGILIADKDKVQDVKSVVSIIENNNISEK